jgi:DNA-binding LytR/AlgR family response regulator
MRRKLKNRLFFTRLDGVLKKLNISSIVVIEACGRYTKLHAPGQQYMLPITLENTIEILGKEQFFQVSRSYAVSLPDITSIDKDVVTVAEMDIPLARTQYKKLLERVYVLDSAL